MKTLRDQNGKEIRKGTVVHYKDGWKKVTAVFVGNQEVNLSGVFFSKVITEKHVPLNDIYEDNAAWAQWWQQSETYRCM